MIIKILLIVSVCAFGLLIMRERPSGGLQALFRLAAVAVVALGVVAVLFPRVTVWTAHQVGVGRGTDLILYVLVVTFLFTTLAAYQRFHHQEQRIIALTREVALLEAAVAPSDETVSEAPET